MTSTAGGCATVAVPPLPSCPKALAPQQRTLAVGSSRTHCARKRKYANLVDRRHEGKNDGGGRCTCVSQGTNGSYRYPVNQMILPKRDILHVNVSTCGRAGEGKIGINPSPLQACACLSVPDAPKGKLSPLQSSTILKWLNLYLPAAHKRARARKRKSRGGPWPLTCKPLCFLFCSSTGTYPALEEYRIK